MYSINTCVSDRNTKSNTLAWHAETTCGPIAIIIASTISKASLVIMH